MIQFIKQLLGLFQAVARLFADRQLLDAGKAEQRAADLEEVIRREEMADHAVATPDLDRNERLRSRFDRARRSE